LAVRACARLGGYLTGDLETPNNSATQEILNRLLTPYLARQLSLDKPEEVSQARL
jgi:DnaJ family protein C protein 13